MAYAENIASPGLKDATFWLGGAVGLMVFIVGILLAQAIRRASYYYSQKKLLKELVKAEEPTTGLRLSPYSRWMTYGFAAFYVVFTAGAVVLRYQGGGKQQPGLLLLQTMIPIVGVMLELLIDDPTEVRLPQRTLRDWWLSRRLGKLDMSIALRELIAQERESGVSDRYRFERAVLVNLQNDVGLSSRYAAQLAESDTIQQQRPEIETELEPIADLDVATVPDPVVLADPEPVLRSEPEVDSETKVDSEPEIESDLDLDLGYQDVAAGSLVTEG
ncbi:MAG TPA: hypothetical protein VL068_02435 [Microthrixaceae bacterium]|nr:hypothetical protein [Microthrixaceae bacterium]